MVVDTLINTRFLLLDNDISDSLNFPEILISKNIQFRRERFYDALGIEELGTSTVSSAFQKYAYGYTSDDLQYISDEISREEKLAELAYYTFTVQGYFNNLLFHLWFAKDNSVSADFSYVRSNPIVSPAVNAISYNHITMYTCTCEQIETAFSEMELAYAYAITKKIKTICPTNKNIDYEQSPKAEDIENPSKLMMNSEIEYHSYNRIERAILFLSSARSEMHLLSKIAAYCSILECLFSTEKEDIKYKISQRVAMYIGNDYEERMFLKKLIGTAYNIRSRYVHGNKISKEDLKPKGDFNKEKLLKTSTELDGVLRIILTKIIMEDHKIFSDDETLHQFFDTLIFNNFT